MADESLANTEWNRADVRTRFWTYQFAALRGIIVSGTGSGSEPPAELTWALILGLARSIVSENESFRNGGPWQSSIGADLFGKQLGLLGLGKIGSRVARVGLAFGMKVVAWSQNLTDEQVLAVGVERARSKEYLLKTSDFVSIHLVLSDRTKDFVGTAELNCMNQRRISLTLRVLKS